MVLLFVGGLLGIKGLLLILGKLGGLILGEGWVLFIILNFWFCFKLKLINLGLMFFIM